MRRVNHVAVRADEISEAAHLAPAHGVGLASERERAGTGLANLPRGQVQVDERGVFGGAAAGLVKPLAVQAEGGFADSTSSAVRNAREQLRRCK